MHSYTLRVVGNGIKAQSANPEVKVKEADPVINQIIDKLKHINQVRLSAALDAFAICTRCNFLFDWSSDFVLILYISIPRSVRHMANVSRGNPLILCTSLSAGGT